MKISNCIHQLRIDFNIQLSPEKVMPRFVNVMIIFGDKITLIDTGVKGSEALIFNYIETQGRTIDEIESIFLSHTHPDHIGALAAIKARTGCKVLVHRNEQLWVENIQLQNSERTVPGFFNLVDQPVTVDGYLEHGAIFKLGDQLSVRIIHAPGHSKGSVNFEFIEEKVLFTADSIPLKMDIPNYDNFGQLKSSLKAIKEIMRFNTLLTSWTEPFFNREKAMALIADGENYINKIDEVVKLNYTSNCNEPLISCIKTIEQLNLPVFWANPIVHQAFQSHIN